jgi:hypothetical protein
VVSFTFLLLYLREIATGIHWIGIDLEVMEIRNNSCSSRESIPDSSVIQSVS